MQKQIVVGVIGNKGGIGKTTVAVTLAAAAVRRGLRVLLVDADPQATTTRVVGLQPSKAFESLVLADYDFADVIQAAPVTFAGGPLAVIAASNSMFSSTANNRETPGRMVRLFDELAESHTYDLIVMDTGPGITEIHAGVYFACTHVLLPARPTRFSMEGLMSTFDYLDNAARRSAAAGRDVAQILGIILNDKDHRAMIHNQMHGWLADKYGALVSEAIPHSAVWENAASLGQSIYEYHSSHFWTGKGLAEARARFDAEVWAPVARVMGVQA